MVTPSAYRAGLFAVDVLAGARGLDRSQSVPGAGERDGYGVDVAAREDLSESAAGGAALVAVFQVHLVLGGAEMFVVHVTDGYHTRLGNFQEFGDVIATHPAGSDGGEGDAAAGGTEPFRPSAEALTMTGKPAAAGASSVRRKCLRWFMVGTPNNVW